MVIGKFTFIVILLYEKLMSVGLKHRFRVIYSVCVKCVLEFLEYIRNYICHTCRGIAYQADQTVCVSGLHSFEPLCRIIIIIHFVFGCDVIVCYLNIIKVVFSQ